MKQACKDEFCTQRHERPKVEPNAKAAPSSIWPFKNNYFQLKNIVLIVTSVLLFTSCQNNKKVQIEKEDVQQQKVDTFLEYIRKHEYDAAYAMAKTALTDTTVVKKYILAISSLIDKGLLVPEDKWISKSDSGSRVLSGKFPIRHLCIFTDQQKDPNAPYCIIITFSADKDDSPTTIYGLSLCPTKQEFEKILKIK